MGGGGGEEKIKGRMGNGEVGEGEVVSKGWKGNGAGAGGLDLSRKVEGGE